MRMNMKTTEDNVNELEYINNNYKIANQIQGNIKNQTDKYTKIPFKTNRELIIAVSCFVLGILFTVFFYYVIVSFVSIISTALFMKYYYGKSAKKN